MKHLGHQEQDQVDHQCRRHLELYPSSFLAVELLLHLGLQGLQEVVHRVLPRCLAPVVSIILLKTRRGWVQLKTNPNSVNYLVP